MPQADRADLGAGERQWGAGRIAGAIGPSLCRGYVFYAGIVAKDEPTVLDDA
jgi:hypothetical protein